MSVDVEALVRQITEEVTAKVLAAISSEPSDSNDWPEWDEFNQLNDSIDSVDSINTNQSFLRDRLHGNIEPVVEDDDDELTAGTSAGNVVPLSTSNDDFRRGGFDPRANPTWFNVQYQRDVVLPSRVAPKG